MRPADDDLDLSAWDAPEPPAGIADAVLARMAEQDGAVATETAPAPRRRYALIGGIAAACVAAGAIGLVVVRGSEREVPSSGAVVAQSAQTLRIGGVRAELDPAASVAWRRDGAVTHVEQRAGVATWRTGGSETLRIDAGATVASVEASGASLRVEVKMNNVDARILGGASLTAAAVAMVTVVVYEGHVKVSGSPGQPTVIVQPGSTYTVTPPAPPPTVAGEPGKVGWVDVTLRAGESAHVHARELPVAIAFDVGMVDCTLDVGGRRHPIAGATFGAGTHRYTVACGPSAFSGELVVDDDSQPSLATLTSVEWTAGSVAIKGKAAPGSEIALLHVGNASYDAEPDENKQFEAHADTDGDHVVVRVQSPPDTAHYYLVRRPACDVAALVDEGGRFMKSNKPREALAAYERALACEPTDAIREKALDAACTAGDRVKAKRHRDALPADTGAVVSCVLNNIEVTPAKTVCDAEGPKERGMTKINMGEHAAALKEFETSLACKRDAYVLQLAFMEACASSNSPKARQYYKQLTLAQQKKFAQICLRQDPPVPYTDETSFLRIEVLPRTAAILVDGNDTGQTGKAIVPVTAGTHKVTFIVDGERFTYPVTVADGAVETIARKLR